MPSRWNYLIVTAANAPQAAAYETQLRRRRAGPLLERVDNVLVVPDPGGRRVGSGASTINCLLEVLRRERSIEKTRVLIVHAGGDSRRLPAYSHCGKIFVPLPGGGDSLFDRLLGVFLELPPNADGAGQVVAASGDALILFDPAVVDLSRPGATALAARVDAQEASRHGVFCGGGDGAVRLYLQKPPLVVQREAGALAPDGSALLDLGVMSLSPSAAMALLEVFCEPGGGWKPHLEELALEHGLDLYREICCAWGTEAKLLRYLASARASGSRWPEDSLTELFPALNAIPLHLRVLERSSFLHFGSTRQLISSGHALVEEDTGARPENTVLLIDSAVEAGGAVTGADSWVEGCRVSAPLILTGNNVVTGADIAEPLELPAGACLDVCRGLSRRGEAVWFLRCYGVEDSFKHAGCAASFNGMPLDEWLAEAGASSADVWDEDLPVAERTLWAARVFPAARRPGEYTRWLWMHRPGGASPEEKAAWARADRYSAAEIALAASQDDYYERRATLRRKESSIT